MKPVVIFGAGKIAEVVQYYFRYESDREVAAFTCDPAYVTADTFEGLPLVPFDQVADRYPPDAYDLFVALGYQDLNALRADRVRQAEAKGYRLASYVHPAAGLPRDAVVGANCFIMNHVCIQPRVTLGDDVFVWSGALIGHHATIGDHSWITSHACIAGSVTMGRRCFVAVNASVANGVVIGDDCFLGANALVTKNMADEQVVIEKASETLRLTSRQFLRMSSFR